MNFPQKIRFILTAAVLTAALTSCGLLDQLGFDTYDYMSEEVTQIHTADDDTAVMLEELLQILVTDSPRLTTFERMSDAITAYRDAVLEYLLLTDYAKYSGNTALIERAMQEYPEYQITQVIPEGEFETTMYRCFGGSVMITHRDGSKFKYLSGVGVYIPLVATTDSGLYADITSLAETEKTYRVRFKIKSTPSEDGSMTESDEYFALVIKREDGTLYIKKLLEGKDISS